MQRDTMQTIAVIVAVFMAAWHIGGMVSANTAATSANTAAIAKLEGALLAHIGGHSHGTKVALAETE